MHPATQPALQFHIGVWNRFLPMHSLFFKTQHASFTICILHDRTDYQTAVSFPHLSDMQTHVLTKILITETAWYNQPSMCKRMQIMRGATVTLKRNHFRPSSYSAGLDCQCPSSLFWQALATQQTLLTFSLRFLISSSLESCLNARAGCAWIKAVWKCCRECQVGKSLWQPAHVYVKTIQPSKELSPAINMLYDTWGCQSTLEVLL